MKRNKRMQWMHSLLAGLLAVVLVVTPILSSLPVLQVDAADDQMWYRVQAGSGNTNGHAYSDASTNPAAVLLNTTGTIASGQDLSLTYQKLGTPGDARFGVFYCYVDDNNWLYVGCNPAGDWYYEYKVNGAGTFLALGSLDIQNDGNQVDFSVSMDKEALQVKVNDSAQTVNNQDLMTLMTNAAGNGRYGFRAGRFGTQVTEFRFTNVRIANQAVPAEWSFLADCAGQVFEGMGPVETYEVSGTVIGADGNGISGARVRIGTDSVLTDAAGDYVFEAIEAGEYELSVSKTGYESTSQKITVEGAMTVPNIVLTEKGSVTYDTYIGNDEFKAAVSKTFPQVMQYELADGSILAGQTEELNAITVNGTGIAPELVSFTPQTDRAVYVMNLKNDGAAIDMQMTVEISVNENDLTWEVKSISKNEGCAKIRSINVPNLNLVTIYDGQEDAQFMGTNNSGNVNSSGDQKITFENGFRANETLGHSYGFVSADGVSAGIWSNSEAGDDKRVMRNNGADSISLTSNVWYYEYGDLADAANYDTIPVSDLPCTKVCLATDLNEDDVVDWQDGAIAYRDIMNNPQGAENVPEMVNYRIVMNFASQATNPFLKTADNIKKVYLATDGLPQAAMLKGYGNEGHDSANSEYGDIGERIGDAEDFQKLIEIAHDYNTEIGIHVNAQEMYPEARSFTNELTSTGFGWGWLDQSYTINRIYDLASNLRYKRFIQLFDRLNDTKLYNNQWPGVVGQGTDETVADVETIGNVVKEAVNNGTNLDFIYLDVWYGDSWETRKIAQQINSLGWRFTTEFGTTGEYDSTWQHWATESRYGGATGKGHNSDVRRFIKNHQTDSFVSNIPSYGGTADGPLLGGYDLNGFEGWGSNNNFDSYINTTFTVNLPTKFLQHYEVTNWVNYEDVGETSPVGNHEKEITLKNEEGDTVVVTRKEAQRSDKYVARTITLNGKKVLDDVTYLLPWTDNDTGEEKLYHWNYDGGTTQWDLPEDWSNLENVTVYALSDQGRENEVSVSVVNGAISLTAEAQTAYVVLKGEETPKTITAYGEKDYVVDPGFNSYAGTEAGTALNGAVWSGDIEESSVKVERRTSGNQNLVMDSPEKEVAVSTTISGLEQGKSYVAEVYVDNKSDAKAIIEVTGAKESVSNYTLKSLAGNYIRCDAHNLAAVSNSRMQIMQVSFVAAASTATLTLKREAGSGETYFDDIRIVQKELNNYREDGSFVQDFETVVQGFYPFVMGSAQGVDDPGTHLSQLNDPYTQSGYRTKRLDDVINGEWSLKQHDTYFRSGIIYRTIPQNFHFEPETTYKVSFKYQAGSNNSFAVVKGVGEDTTEMLDYMDATIAAQAGEKCTTNTFTFYIEGDESGQSWFGIYANAANQGNDKMGEFDFILDDLVIEEAAMSINKTNLTVTDLAEEQQLEVTFKDGVPRNVIWTTSDANIAEADENGNVLFYDYGTAVLTASAMINGVQTTVDCTVTLQKEVTLTDKEFFAEAYANSQEEAGEDNRAEMAIDGDGATIWHTEWNGFEVSGTNPAILTLKVSEHAETPDLLQLLQRPSGTNGIIKEFQYIIGTTFDSDTHEVGNILKQENVTVADSAAVAGGVIDLPTIDDMGGKYLQIRILSGGGNFGAAAEVQAIRNISYATEGNEKVLAQNRVGKLVDGAESMKSSEYTTESWKVLEDAVKSAKQILNSASSTADDVKKAENALKEAIAGLQTVVTPPTPSVNKSALQTLYNACAALKASDYTADSWKNFTAALTNAKNVLDRSDVTQSAVDQAVTALTTARNTLKKADAATPVQPLPKKGYVKDIKQLRYKVTKATAKTKTVSVVKAKNKKYVKITIPATVKINGYTFKVTKIEDKAFRKNTKLATVVIGANITNIGKESFSGCKKLKNITINSKDVKKFGKNAFKGISSKAKIKVPKKKLNDYKKKLKTAKLSSKVKVIKK